MNSVLPYLINWLQQFGYPALWLAVFIASAGVPLPIVLVLLAAGAFAALGDFNIIILAITAISAAVCGDTVGYWVGRKWGSRALDWLERSRRFHLISPEVIARSRAYFGRRGGWAIFLSRFLFSALGGVINLLAGADPYPFRRFLLFDSGGETLGAIIPLVLGYLFGASLDLVGDLLSGISALLVGLLIVIVLTYYLLKLLPQAATKRKKEAMPSTAPTVDQVVSRGGSGNLLP